MVLINHRNHQTRVSPFVPFVYVRTPKHQHLNEREVISHCCQLQSIISVFLVNSPIDRKPAIQQLHNLLEVISRYSPQHAVAAGVRENGGVLAVPCDLVVEVRRVVEQEGVWGIPRKTGPPFVEIERQPLRWTEDCLGRDYGMLACSPEIKHEKNIIVE